MDSLDFIEVDLVAAPVILLRRACRRVIRHRRGILERAAVVLMCGDARGAERVWLPIFVVAMPVTAAR
ncbi:hypothetical protein [Paraburkholderia hospita]|uniref:hypothetical protein n=1 Tax=Paraburkholderia hospita TaxID=169430 RepID=UPI0013FDBDEE|nr:hypothetical protein [Paraburkholderia hospita]